MKYMEQIAKLNDQYKDMAIQRNHQSGGFINGQLQAKKRLKDVLNKQLNQWTLWILNKKEDPNITVYDRKMKMNIQELNLRIPKWLQNLFNWTPNTFQFRHILMYMFLLNE